MSSDGGSPSGSDSSTSDTPSYTPDELVTLVLEFYRFLTTLHYDEAHLKIPPPGGWPHLTADVHAGVSDYTLAVMRRLPCFDAESRADIHYKSRLIDYASCTEQGVPYDHRQELEFWSGRGEVVDHSHVFCLAEGHESFGRDLFLNVRDGEITEYMVRADQLDAVDMQDYFNTLKDAYQTLKLIPCLGRVTMEAWDVPESTDEIIREQVVAQKDAWGTELDVQYLRQLYRHYGWPDAFQKEAFRAVDELMGSMVEKRLEWERCME